MANLNIRVDDTLKKQTEEILESIGMSLSTATTIFYKQVCRYKGIPFELLVDPFYSPENQTRLRAAMRRMDETDGTIHELLEDTDD